MSRLFVFHSLISYAKEKTTFTEFIDNENMSVIYVFYAGLMNFSGSFWANILPILKIFVSVSIKSVRRQFKLYAKFVQIWSFSEKVLKSQTEPEYINFFVRIPSFWWLRWEQIGKFQKKFFKKCKAYYS